MALLAIRARPIGVIALADLACSGRAHQPGLLLLSPSPNGVYSDALLSMASDGQCGGSQQTGGSGSHVIDQ